MTEAAPSLKPVVLAMDGSTRASTAAFLLATADGWQVLARRTDTDGRGQARILLRLVDDMLLEVGWDPIHIRGIAVGIGPGTFTGVRIAVATARALALALSVPVVGIGTLAALAAEAVAEAGRGSSPPDVVIPLVDARRGQVFYGIYQRVAGETPEESQDRVAEAPSMRPRYVRTQPFAVCDRRAIGELARSLTVKAGGGASPDRRVLVAGEADELSAIAADGDECPTTSLLEVRAEYLVKGQSRLQEREAEIEGRGAASWLRFALDERRPPRGVRPGEPGSPEAVRPIYVRSPDADIHITKMRDPWASSNGGG